MRATSNFYESPYLIDYINKAVKVFFQYRFQLLIFILQRGNQSEKPGEIDRAIGAQRRRSQLPRLHGTLMS